MPDVGQLIALQIDQPASGGRMIGRSEGRVILVAGAIPGERVRARITRVARGVAFADAVTIDEPSPDRRTPFCDAACGGTAYAHIAYERQLALKAEVIADGLQRIGRLAPPAPVRVAPSPPSGYRMRARLHRQGGRIGFYREGSHQLCDAKATQQILPDTGELLDRLAEALLAAGDPPIRELDVSENISATLRAVHLEAAGAVDASRLVSAAALPGLTGLAVTGIAPLERFPETHLIGGDPYVFDRLDVDGTEVVLRRHVLSFFQANRYLLQDLVAHVVAQLAPVSEAGPLVDLYAGVGLFAVTLARLGAKSVTAVEGEPSSARDLEVNAASTRSVTVRHQAVERFLAGSHAGLAAVVLDPPRTGLSPDALTGVLALGAPSVVYVSCDVATFARDARGFIAAGYRLERLVGFDLFPNTAHVETVATFRR